MALVSTAVVLPLMLVYLLFGITDAFPVIVNTVILVANFDLQRSRVHALGLVFGNFAGGPKAPVALIACNAMLINLGLAMATGPGSLSVWLTRLFQFRLAGAFAIGMLILLWHYAATQSRSNPQKATP